MYSAYYDTIIAKQLYSKLSYYNIFIYCRNLIHLTYSKKKINSIYRPNGSASVSSQVFGHLRSFNGWIQTEACVIPRITAETEIQIET